MTPLLLKAHFERTYPALYFNPDRWDTTDGYIPWRLYLCYTEALFQVWAMDKVTIAGGIALATADTEKPEGRTLRDRVVAEAYPQVVKGAPHG